ncbi:Vegetative incompatibility protein HET-E-1 [Durusdinium trenchii]|uniref:Vegetative incompatibility protein HET-E-1 n=1 Tax=Durusdinium trenchii TaxID=1381693 RepID=A0ABP0NDV0_9DINO
MTALPSLLWSAVFSPDGAWVLTASADCSARVFDAASAECFRTLYGHEDMVMSVAFLTVSALLCPDLPTESSKTGQSTLVLHEASPLADQFLKHDPKDDESQRSPIPFGELIVE